MSDEPTESSGSGDPTDANKAADAKGAADSIKPLEVAQIPLFPLRTVLFTGGQLPLKIFETRYISMVSRCLKDSVGFGVVLLRSGGDTRNPDQAVAPDIFDVGTQANIVDFNQLNDGLLGIVAQGTRKFRVQRTWDEADLLMMGEVQFLPEEPAAGVGSEHDDLVLILQQLVEHPMVQKLNLDIDFADARSVGWRLAELLPIEPEIKQTLLQLNWPRERLNELSRLVHKLRA